MNQSLRSLSAALMCTLAAVGANASCGPPAYQESRLSPSGDWDGVYGQAAGLVTLGHKGVYTDSFGCFDVMGSLGGPNDLSDRFQIKLGPDAYYGEVVFTQMYLDMFPSDGFGGVNRGTFVTLARLEAPDVPIFTQSQVGDNTPKFLIGYGTYVVTVQTREFHFDGGLPGEYDLQFVVQQVPEPASYGLWLGGLGLLAGAAYRRRSRQ